MVALTRWFWTLIPANPVLLRVVQGGSRSTAHMWARTGYLFALITLMLLGLYAREGATGAMTLTDLAKSGTWVFVIIAYGQVVMICLLAPVFFAGALTQEQSSDTIDILLTTPLSNLQIVLGSLLGRLFFVLGLLASGLPLFAVLLLFGGVPVSSVFVAFAVAALTALFVGAVAVTLAVLRAGGRKAVFVFIVVVAAYLFGAWGVDGLVRLARDAMVPAPAAALATVGAGPGVATAAPGVAGGSGAAMGASPAAGGGSPAGAGQEVQTAPPMRRTTWVTPLHPLLVLRASIDSANYRPPRAEDLPDAHTLTRFYMTRPLAGFAIVTLTLSTVLVLFSATQLRRVAGGERPVVEGIKRALGVDDGERRRPPRPVGANPVAWRESQSRAGMRWAVWSRWGFFGLAMFLGLLLLWLYHRQALPSLRDGRGMVLGQADVFREGLRLLLLVQVVLIGLMAIYRSAGAVSREREDGTLDLLLVTPITPRQYLWGKLRGLIGYLSVMLAAPVLTLAFVALYSTWGAMVDWPTATVEQTVTLPAGAASGGQMTVTRPLLLPESALLFPLMLLPFVALCVAVGMSWSIKARGVFGAVAPTMGAIGALVLVTGFCGYHGAEQVPVLGPIVNGFSPLTNLSMLLNPHERIGGFLLEDGQINPLGRFSLVLAALAAAGGYTLVVWTAVAHMVNSFDHTVRRLSGIN